MIELNFVFLTIFILIIIQSILGVGILVLGTPFLLILEFDILEIVSILLPISILTSFLNLVFIRINKIKLDIKINSITKNLFFFICLPSIFIGLFLLEIYHDRINFKYFVSGVIFISLILTRVKSFVLNIDNKVKILFLSLIGIIHGLTNSGGTLLSLFMSSHEKKNNSRYSITFFYFCIALFQFFIFNYFFEFKINISNFKILIILLPIGIAIGNFLIKFIDENKFKSFISLLSLLTCVFLITS